ncbi:MAG: hypothetical protein WBA00_14975 [Rhodococcus sp. (in: high G+C Gram-positive bacteria)]
MGVSCAFFADYARQSDQKLDVLGGIWDWCVLPSLEHPVEAHLVVLLQRGPDDIGVPGRLQVTVTEVGEASPLHSFELPVSGHIEGEQQALAFPISIAVRRTGRHVVHLRAGVHDVGFALSLDVRSMDVTS